VSLQTRLDALIAEIGADIKALQDAAGGAGTKVSDLPSATLPLTGAELIPVVQGGVSKKATPADLGEISKCMGSSQTNNTITPASVTELELTVAPGSYLVKYWLCYQTAATTTGIQFHLDHSGTVTRNVGHRYELTTGAAAATGISDQATTATAQMMEGKGHRADNTPGGFTQGVDTANADMFAVLEAIVVVTVSGTLKLMFASEVASSNAVMQPGSAVTLKKVG